jgi:hypothetical protein
MQLRLRAAQQRGPDLRGAGAQQQGDQLPFRLGRVKAAAMSARFHALRDHDVGAGVFRSARLGDGQAMPDFFSLSTKSGG